MRPGPGRPKHFSFVKVNIETETFRTDWRLGEIASHTTGGTFQLTDDVCHWQFIPILHDTITDTRTLPQVDHICNSHFKFKLAIT